MREFTTEEIRQSYESLKAKTEKSGYLLNPDEEFTLGIVESLLTNMERYGYPLCPCRLTSGSREADLDIICPCDYRDPDLAEYGRCYCALYVARDATPEQLNGSIPERRPKNPAQAGKAETMPIWRCPVCGYLCARPNPPEVCPICGASGDRFERFDFALNIVRSELRRPLNNTGTGENNNEKRLIKIYTQNAKSYYWQLAATAREETEARAIIRELLNRPDTLTIRMASSGKVIEEFGAMMDSKTKGDKAKMKKYKCSVCGYIYDPAKGDPSSGVKPGTAFEDLPEDWVCPVCGSPKSKFKPIEE